MDKTSFIAGDWGADRLRLILCHEGRVADTVSGPGIGTVAGSARATLLDLIAPWARDHGALPILLCGMVGSSLGWRETPYLPCPVLPAAVRNGLVRFTAAGHAVAIAPGLSCTNPLGSPDIMRGEETRILGALATMPDLAKGRQIICLPGLHSKWVLLKDGHITHFQTAMTGELFATLRRHSILGQGTQGLEPDDGTAFQAGLARGMEEQGATLPHLLFETRSRQLRDGRGPAWGLSFLSGLLIGQDCAGTLSRYRPAPGLPVTIIAAAAPGRCFAAALARLGLNSRLFDGDAAVQAGLLTLASASP